MKLLKVLGCWFPDTRGNEGLPTIINYNSRRTVNGLLDTGSTPVYSTMITALYVAKAIYNAVTFMNAELHLILLFHILKYLFIFIVQEFYNRIKADRAY